MTPNSTHPAGGAGAVKLKDCPIGLFTSEHGALCLKTEYGDNEGRIDAYIVDSGEFFWGGTNNAAEQRQVLVTPVVLRPPVPEPEAEGEPVAWLFQHEETGLTQCVDHQQVEWGFEKNNPRLQKICPLYTRPSSEAEIADLRAKLEQMRQALETLVERAHNFGTFSIDNDEVDPLNEWDDTVVPALVVARQALTLAGEEKEPG